MRRRPMPPVREGTVNVTPLIDIVMCMIIFFMLVAKIGINTGEDRDVIVPASFLGVDLKDLGNALTLNVNNGPNIPGTPAQPVITCFLNGQQHEIRIRTDSAGRISYPLYDMLRAGLKGNPEFKVIIRADQNTEYQFLQPVLAECTRAGLNYDFATQRGEAEPK
jgi:biopolymer transport protein ExbD